MPDAAARIPLATTSCSNKLRGSDVPPEKARGSNLLLSLSSWDVEGCRCFSLHQLCLVTIPPYWRPFSVPRHTASERQLQRQPRTAANLEDICAPVLGSNEQKHSGTSSSFWSDVRRHEPS